MSVLKGRTVFKFFAAFGPGGSVPALTEKLCKKFFPEAYDFKSDGDFTAPEEAQIRAIRQDFCNDLFDYKSTFLEKGSSENPLVQLKAYVEMLRLINKYERKVVALEKQKINKEKIFYLREEN